MPRHLLPRSTFLAMAILSTAIAFPAHAQAPAADGSIVAGWSAGPRAARQPTARHENAVAAVESELFLIGGGGNRPLDVLNLASGKWRQVTGPPMEVHYAQAVVLGGRIHVIGAMTGPWPREGVVPRTSSTIRRPIAGAKAPGCCPRADAVARVSPCMKG